MQKPLRKATKNFLRNFSGGKFKKLRCLSCYVIIDLELYNSIILYSSQSSPIYIGLEVHSRSRCKAIIKVLHRPGLCFAYCRLLEIEQWLATSAGEPNETDGFVCPAHLPRSLLAVTVRLIVRHKSSETSTCQSKCK